MVHLIVNADDFGQSPGINRGIIMARENGIVTSTSLMVRWPAAGEAAEYARRNPQFGVGLHIDLCEWRYRNGQWEPVYEVVALSDSLAVAKEIRKQVETFEAMVGKPPTHLDSHQHVHQREAVLPVVEEIAARLEVPVRSRNDRVRYCSAFYGQLEHGEPFPEGITVERLEEILDTLPDGYTELGCHPGFGDNLDSMYCRERAVELAVLCDPKVRTMVAREGLELCSFARLKG